MCFVFPAGQIFRDTLRKDLDEKCHDFSRDFSRLFVVLGIGALLLLMHYVYISHH